LGWQAPIGKMPFSSQGLIDVAYGFQIYRMLVRMGYSARIYGPWFALGAPVRMLWGNAINLLSTARAVHQFARAKWRGEPLRWVKTAHAYPKRSALMTQKRLLGEILADLGYVSRDQVRRALQVKPEGVPLGEYLVRQGRLTDEQRWDALSVQQGSDARPAKLTASAPE